MTGVLALVVSGTIIAAALTAGALAGALVCWVGCELSHRHQIEALQDHARLAHGCGYRAGLKEGMAAEDRLWDRAITAETELAAHETSTI